MFVNHDWEGLYPDAVEDMDEKVPKPLSKLELKQTVLVDASHAIDWVTRRGHTGILFFLGRTPIRSHSKQQNTVEAATYGSELIALRIGVEFALDMHWKLRMLGLVVEHPTVTLCDNESVVKNMQFPSGTLKKKHLAVSRHECREAVSMGATLVGHIGALNNMSDALTKPKGPHEHYALIKEALCGRFDTCN